MANDLEQAHHSDEGFQEAANRKVQEDMEREKTPILVWEPVHVNTLSSRSMTQIACGFDHSLILNGTVTSTI